MGKRQVSAFGERLRRDYTRLGYSQYTLAKAYSAFGDGDRASRDVVRELEAAQATKTTAALRLERIGIDTVYCLTGFRQSGRFDNEWGLEIPVFGAAAQGTPLYETTWRVVFDANATLDAVSLHEKFSAPHLLRGIQSHADMPAADYIDAFGKMLTRRVEARMRATGETWPRYVPCGLSDEERKLAEFASWSDGSWKPIVFYELWSSHFGFRERSLLWSDWDLLVMGGGARALRILSTKAA